jgi:hypothetical protein
MQQIINQIHISDQSIPLDIAGFLWVIMYGRNLRVEFSGCLLACLQEHA